MKCMECKHFERLKDGMRGGINGSCKLRNTSSYHATRNGNQKACKTYFEPQEISEHNMKMWEEIFKAESEDKG